MGLRKLKDTAEALRSLAEGKIVRTGGVSFILKEAHVKKRFPASDNWHPANWEDLLPILGDVYVVEEPTLEDYVLALSNHPSIVEAYLDDDGGLVVDWESDRTKDTVLAKALCTVFGIEVK